MDFREYTVGEVREMVIKEYGENIPENQWIAYGYLKKKLDLLGPDRKWLPQHTYDRGLELILEALDI